MIRVGVLSIKALFRAEGLASDIDFANSDEI